MIDRARSPKFGCVEILYALFRNDKILFLGVNFTPCFEFHRGCSCFTRKKRDLNWAAIPEMMHNVLSVNICLLLESAFHIIYTATSSHESPAGISNSVVYTETAYYPYQTYKIPYDFLKGQLCWLWACLSSNHVNSEAKLWQIFIRTVLHLCCKMIELLFFLELTQTTLKSHENMTGLSIILVLCSINQKSSLLNVKARKEKSRLLVAID